VPASRKARIEFEPPPVKVTFYTEVIRGQWNTIELEQITKVSGQISDAVHVFADLFPDVDYAERAESWTAPDLSADQDDP
jgi:hypothetical protein